MKTPLWEEFPDALVQLINGARENSTSSFVTADLITISFNSSSDFSPHQLTHSFVGGEGPGDAFPSFSPDSETIIFVRGNDIWTMDRDGSNQALLLLATDIGAGGIYSPVYSPDGTQIAFVFNTSQIYKANNAGGGVTLVYDAAATGAFGLHWGSNDVIIFAGNSSQEIWTVNPDGSGAAALFSTSQIPIFPKWSSDATKIVYVQFYSGTNTYQIWSADADGSNNTQLTNFPTSTATGAVSWISFEAAFTPGDQRIIFAGAEVASNGVSGPGIWMMRTDGSNVEKILTPVDKWAGDQPSEQPPFTVAISPNGDWIAYDLEPNRDTGLAGIWRIKLPIPLKLRAEISMNQGTGPLLNPIFLTTADTNITTYDGSPTWNGFTILVDQAQSQMKAHWKRGLDVDQAVIVFSPRLVDPLTGSTFPDNINATPWIQAARSGVFSAVDVQIDRAYFESWDGFSITKTPVGVLTIFAGRAVEIDCTDTLVAMTLNDYRELFATMIPPTVYQAQCRQTLFNAGCRLLESDFRVTGSLIGGSTTKVLLTTDIVPGGSGTFLQGKIRFTSGNNQGFVRTISNWTAPNSLSLLNPLPFAVQVGDTFEVFPGCNKTLATCTLFGNQDNYGGFPYIPTATSAL